MATSRKFPLPIGPVLIMCAASLWALDGIVRRSLFVLPPITIVFFEHLIGALLLLPLVLPRLRKEKVTAKDLGLVAIVSLFSGLLGTLWFTQALLKVNFISFSVVYLLQKLQPIFAITSAHIFLKERITKDYAKWAILALVAAYFVTFKNGYISLATGSGTIQAALLAIGAAACWGTGTTLSKMLLKRKSDVLATGLRFSVTTLLALAAMFILGQSATFTQPTVSHLGRLVFIALSTGMLAMYIYYRGLKQTEAKVSTIVELIYPLLAVLIDAVLYKSFLAPSQYLAGLVMVFAIFKIAQLQKRTDGDHTSELEVTT